MKISMSDLQYLTEKGRLAFDQPWVIVAGGAPRDVLSGVPVKDIDMWTFMDASNALQHDRFRFSVKKFAGMLNGSPSFAAIDNSYPDLVDLGRIALPDGEGVIEVCGIWDDPVQDVQRFDFGLSQVFVTPRGYYQSADAELDRQHKVITYMGSRSEGAANGSKHRLARLRQKYTAANGWTFENCEKLDALSEQPLPQRKFTEG